MLSHNVVREPHEACAAKPKGKKPTAALVRLHWQLAWVARHAVQGNKTDRRRSNLEDQTLKA